jgi:hypothetical protein
MVHVVTKIYSYSDALKAMADKEPVTYKNLMPSVLVGFDNTAGRNEYGIIFDKNLAGTGSC